MNNDQHKQFNYQIRFLRGFRRFGGLRCWYNHHPQGPVEDQEVTTVTGVWQQVNNTVPLWSWRSSADRAAFMKQIKRTINSLCFMVRPGSRGESQVPFRRGKTCLGGFLVVADLGAYVTFSVEQKGSSNKHVTLVQSSQLFTTWDPLNEKPRRCVWTRGTETCANVVRYSNKWQNVLEITVHTQSDFTQACPEKREMPFTFGQNMKVQDWNEFWILNIIRSLDIQMCQNKKGKCKTKNSTFLPAGQSRQPVPHATGRRNINYTYIRVKTCLVCPSLSLYLPAILTLEFWYSSPLEAKNKKVSVAFWCGPCMCPGCFTHLYFFKMKKQTTPKTAAVPVPTTAGMMM